MCHPRLEFVAGLCRLDTGPIVDPHGGAVPQASAASPGAPHETGKPTPGSAIARGFPKQWWSSDVAPIGRRRKPSWFRETGLPLIRHLEWPPSRPNRPLDFPIGVILTDGISGPDRGRDPTDHGDLQNQAHDSCDRTIDREKGQPRQQDSDEQAHAADPRMISRYPICYHDTTWCASVPRGNGQEVALPFGACCFGSARRMGTFINLLPGYKSLRLRRYSGERCLPHMARCSWGSSDRVTPAASRPSRVHRSSS